MIINDELSPKFLNQKGGSISISLGYSAIGHGLYIQPYDEYENEVDSANVFIKSKKQVQEMRDLLNEILESDMLIDDFEKE